MLLCVVGAVALLVMLRRRGQGRCDADLTLSIYHKPRVKCLVELTEMFDNNYRVMMCLSCNDDRLQGAFLLPNRCNMFKPGNKTLDTKDYISKK